MRQPIKRDTDRAEAVNAINAQIGVVQDVDERVAALEKIRRREPNYDSEPGYQVARRQRKPIVRARSRGEAATDEAVRELMEEAARVNERWEKGVLPRIEAIDKPLAEGIAKANRRRRLEQRISNLPPGWEPPVDEAPPVEVDEPPVEDPL